MCKFQVLYILYIIIYINTRTNYPLDGGTEPPTAIDWGISIMLEL